MRARRVFGIGLNKTGTVSLHEALGLLGYPGLHWGGPTTRRAVLRALDAGQPLLTYLDPGLVAFTDIEDLTENFDLVDRQYPGSGFILTVRPLDAWLDSRKRHVEHNRAKRALGRYAGRFLEVERERWTADYRRHCLRVQSYFEDRPDDLLVIDVTAGDPWIPLCRFLDRPVPDVPFPWSNRSDARPRLLAP